MMRCHLSPPGHRSVPTLSKYCPLVLYLLIPRFWIAVSSESATFMYTQTRTRDTGQPCLSSLKRVKFYQARTTSSQHLSRAIAYLKSTPLALRVADREKSWRKLVRFESFDMFTLLLHKL